MDQLKAALALARSFRKRDWSLEDYPVRVYRRPAEPAAPSARLKPLPWTAQVINWWLLRGDGETRDEALKKLQESFSNYRLAHPKLPRPGLRVPLAFELASSERIDRHRETAHDILERVIGISPDDCLLTDESSLWDFHTAESNDEYVRKIDLLYRVDISDLESATIAEIAERIDARPGV